MSSYKTQGKAGDGWSLDKWAESGGGETTKSDERCNPTHRGCGEQLGNTIHVFLKSVDPDARKWHSTRTSKEQSSIHYSCLSHRTQEHGSPVWVVSKTDLKRNVQKLEGWCVSAMEDEGTKNHLYLRNKGLESQRHRQHLYEGAE